MSVTSIEPAEARARQDDAPLLEAEDLAVHFDVRGAGPRRGRSTVRAVDGVSLSLRRGETLGIVGESGSGKTTLGRAVLRLVRPTGGAVRFEGRDLTTLSKRELRAIRSRMQIIFQDPAASLDPRKRIRWSLAEPLRTHLSLDKDETERRIIDGLERVGLDKDAADRRPHEFSGGQLQRIAIARALMLDLRLLVCDEPTSALDVSAQAQVVNLLRGLQASLGIAYVFISHDLAVVGNLADRVAVMYLGRIVETGPTAAVFARPRHPYTRALIAAAPEPDPELEARRAIEPLAGDIPDPANPPSGCAFHTRCPFATDACRRERPQLTADGGDTLVACHNRDDIDPEWNAV